jgi:transposase
MKNRDARRLSSEAQENQRLSAVRAILAGTKQVKVARIFHVTVQSVCLWFKKYKDGGLRALRGKQRGRPKEGSALLPWQAAVIVRILRSKDPDQLCLPFYLWTREAVRDLIKNKYGVRLSRWTVGRYLKRWGFTPQKPLRRAYEQDPKAVRRWLEIDYPAICKRAKFEKALIFWGDETGLRSDHTVGRSYGLRGQGSIIPGTGKRFGCNMISAITNQGQLYFMIIHERFNSLVFIKFMNRLIKQSPKKIFLIVDGHPSHKSQVTRAWLDRPENKKHIKVFLLPGYSPELNPDELVNQDVKSNALGQRRPRTREEMVDGIRSYLHKRQRQPHVVRNYFLEQHVRYAA